MAPIGPEEFTIRVACSNLVLVGDPAKANPLVAMFVQRGTRAHFVEYSVKKVAGGDARDPSFVTPFVFQAGRQEGPTRTTRSRFSFGTGLAPPWRQPEHASGLAGGASRDDLHLQFTMYDMGDAKSKDASDADMLGCVSVSLGTLRSLMRH